jgi:tetratricopeptide (TPR) repeat protein
MTREMRPRGKAGLCGAALAVLAVLVLAASLPAWAADEAAAGGEPAATATAPADANAAAGASAALDNGAGEDLEKLLKGMSDDEVRDLIKTAVKSRLEVERKQVIEEIKEDLLLDPADIAKAVTILTSDAKNTQKDNIDRIIKALAVADYRFGKAVKLLADGKAEDAAKAIEKDLNVQEATYRNAARYTLYARTLAAQDKLADATDAYQKVMVVMGDRISLAAAAAIESAALFEKMQRFSYAAQMYAYAVANYGLTLDDEVLDTIKSKTEDYATFASDPLGWAQKEMAVVRGSLDKGDSGKATQGKQEKIIAVITDMIKTAEEKQQSGQGQGQQRQRQKQPGEGEGEGEGEGKGKGKGQKPQGTQQPSNPAPVSALVPGPVARPTAVSQTHNTNETGDWSTLPPRERQKVEQLRTKVMSERYRDLISKYRTKVAEQKSE